MGKIINLRTARKQAKRRATEQRSARNRLVHGSSKADRALERSRSEKARNDLDRHRIEEEKGH